MAKKPKSYVDETALAIHLLDTFTRLAQDPLLSSLGAWWWIQKKSGLGWDDRAALRVGVIDINRARAGVESSIALEMIDRAVALTKEIGQGLAIGAAGKVNPVLGAGAALASTVSSGGGAGDTVTNATYKTKPSKKQIDAALQILGDAGMLGNP